VTLFANKAANIILQGTDQDNDPIIFELVSGPSRGMIAGFDKSTGTLTYIPTPNSPGSDSFTFKVIDSHNAESNIGRVSAAVNQMLTVSDVSAATSSNVPVNIILKAMKEDNAASLKFTLISSPLHGKLSELSHIDGASARVTYTPDKGYAGNDLFKFKVDDKNADTNNVAKVSITVIASPPSSASIIPSETGTQNVETDITESTSLTPNSPPVANNQNVQTDQNKKIRIMLEGMDLDKDKMTYSIVKQPTHGSVNNFDTSTGKLTYKPNTNFAGDDNITFKITDQKGDDSNIAIVLIKVKNSEVTAHSQSYIGSLTQDNGVSGERILKQVGPSVNHQPTAKTGPDRVVYEGTTDVGLQGTGKDPDGDTLAYSWEQTAGPHVELNDADTVNPTFNAPDVAQNKVLKFVLTVSDGKGGQDTDDVKITVKDRPLSTDNQLIGDQNQVDISVNQTGR
jgi:hypothetical protein